MTEAQMIHEGWPQGYWGLNERGIPVWRPSVNAINALLGAASPMAALARHFANERAAKARKSSYVPSGLCRQVYSEREYQADRLHKYGY